MKIIASGEWGGSEHYAIIDVWLDENKASFDELENLIARWSNEPARISIKIDPHHISKVDEFIGRLNAVDDMAREKGIEVRLEIACSCEDCRRISMNAIVKTVQWRSRWE
jgi:hypothetical protein